MHAVLENAEERLGCIRVCGSSLTRLIAVPVQLVSDACSEISATSKVLEVTT